MINARPSCATFEGSPVAKAIEILRPCSLVELATVMESLAKVAADVDRYERCHAAALKIWQNGPGRPALYNNEKLLDEMEYLIKNNAARSINDAAIKVKNTLTDPHEACNAVARLSVMYIREGRPRPEKILRQNSDLKQMPGPSEPVIKKHHKGK